MKHVIILFLIMYFNLAAGAVTGYNLNNKDVYNFCVNEVNDRSKDGLKDYLDEDSIKLILLGWNPGYWIGKGIGTLAGWPTRKSIENGANRAAILRCINTTRLQIIGNWISSQNLNASSLLKQGLDTNTADFVADSPDATTSQDDFFYRMYEFTKTAKHIWQELLICFDKNGDLARTAFTSANQPLVCNGDIDPSTLAKNISLLKANFYNFLTQTESKPISINDYFDNRLQYDFFISSDDMFAPISNSFMSPDATAKATHFIRMYNSFKTLKTPIVVHPLLSQLSLQILAKFYLNAGPNDFFKINSKFQIYNKQYLYLFNNALRVLLIVNNSPGQHMGLWPFAGWTVWTAMNERLLLFANKPKDPENISKEDLRANYKNFYYRYLTNFGVVTSNITPNNLPEIYIKESNNLIKEYYKMDDPYQNINIAN